MRITETIKNHKEIVVFAFILLVLGIVFHGINSYTRIVQVSLSSLDIDQGDRINASISYRSARTYRNVTAAFVVINDDGETAAWMESDMFTIFPAPEKSGNYRFRWSDLNPLRTGKLVIDRVELRQYRRPGKFKVLAKYPWGKVFNIRPVANGIRRMFVLRENAVWWLTEMGYVSNDMSVSSNLNGCILFGGYTSFRRSDWLQTKNSKGLCYWEITGYTVRQMALEYERTGNEKYLTLAKRAANSIVKYMRKGNNRNPSTHSLPTFSHFDGRVGDWDKDRARLFDHGQILMGMLELTRVMKKFGQKKKFIAKYETAARQIGNFMLRIQKINKGLLPSGWLHAESRPTKSTEPTSKVVIGYKRLHKLTGNSHVPVAAQKHLDYILNAHKPYQGKDHHGRAYNAYGFIYGYLDYNKVKYLEAAKQWTEKITLDMDPHGKLIPEKTYSVIPAQSQQIRNATLLWKLTADPKYLQWAERSVNFLTRSSKAHMYQHPILKLGKFYRESGGMLNNIPDDGTITSWGTIFHIDAMYHFLGAKYGHVYIDDKRVHSMIGPIKLKREKNRLVVEFKTASRENTGLYINTGRRIKNVTVDGDSFPYFTAKTARIPPLKSAGRKTLKVVIELGDTDKPRIEKTNSTVLDAFRDKHKLETRISGRPDTPGILQVKLPGKYTSVVINGENAPEDRVQYNKEKQLLNVRYQHGDKPTLISIGLE